MYDMEEKLRQIDEVIAQGPFTDTWESLVNYQVPDWYMKAKFGIFIHWGVFSVPAYDNEWYARNMYIEGSRAFRHHVETYGPQKDFGYKDFIPMFRLQNFDPVKWAEIFKDAGAQYVIPVAEHHDGFQMYESELSEWNAKEKGPERDVYGDLVKAVRENGMESGASSHRIEHWFYLGHGKDYESDIREPLKRGDLYWPSVKDPDQLHTLKDANLPNEEYMNDWLIRTCEIIDKYCPSVLYFDWWIQNEAAKPYLKKAAAYYYNRAAERGQKVVLNYKHDAYAFGSAVPDMERGGFDEAKPYYWQTDTSVARNSWCYTVENVYKSTEEIIQNLADTCSKNGNLLLNVCPKSDGTFPEEDLAIMKGVGEWLRINGEAIYSAHPWRIFSEGDVRTANGQFTDAAALPYTSADYRFTANGDKIYAIAMAPGKDGEYLLKSFGWTDDSIKRAFQGIVDRVDVLGIEDDAEFEQLHEGMRIRTKTVDGKNPVVFRISVR